MGELRGHVGVLGVEIFVDVVRDAVLQHVGVGRVLLVFQVVAGQVGVGVGGVFVQLVMVGDVEVLLEGCFVVFVVQVEVGGVDVVEGVREYFVVGEGFGDDDCLFFLFDCWVVVVVDYVQL